MAFSEPTPNSGIGISQKKLAVQKLSRRDAIRGGAAVLVAATGFAAPYPSFAEEGTPLAIKGYDPVAYFTDGKPTPGMPEFEYEWNDHVWRFSNAQHRDLFKADPVRYAPQFGNYCAMALSLGQIVTANPNYWLISDGKLYVFGSAPPAGPVLFQRNLAENIVKANHNRSLLPKQ